MSLRRAAVFAIGILWTFPAWAQVGGLYWQCVAPSTASPQGAFCPASGTYPIPVATGGGLAAAVTPSDSTVLSPPAAALWNGHGSACAIAVRTPGSSTTVTFSNVPAGGMIFGPFDHVMAATTCDGIIARY